MSDTTFMTDEEMATAVGPCPAWCEHIAGPGHPYNGADDDGTLWRNHESGGPGAIHLHQDEFNRAGVVTTMPITLRIWGEDGAATDAAGARTLAAELLAMADRLDEITAN
jgi:hypothetical protein